MCFWEAWLKASIQTEGYDGGWDGKWEVTIGFLPVSTVVELVVFHLPIGVQYDQAIDPHLAWYRNSQSIQSEVQVILSQSVIYHVSLPGYSRHLPLH
jgi:hypothetical protein